MREMPPERDGMIIKEVLLRRTECSVQNKMIGCWRLRRRVYLGGVERL